MWFHSKRLHFTTYHCVFFPTVVWILVGRLDSCFLTHTKKYMTPIHALMLQNMSKCVFILDASRSQCNFITLLGKYTQQKKVGWEVIFSELGFAGSTASKPRREFEGSTLELFFHVFLSLNGVFIVQLIKLPLKSHCKTYRICQGKPNHTLARYVFFLPTLFYKNHRSILLWWKP